MSLERFVAAQDGVYPGALAELVAGAKRGHWMWFVLPQLAGLGRSDTARFFAIRDLAEARAYAAHPVLGPRLIAACAAVTGWAGQRSAVAMLGPIDAIKLRSCCTLFEAAALDPVPFARCLERLFGGERDHATLALLAGGRPPGAREGEGSGREVGR